MTATTRYGATCEVREREREREREKRGTHYAEVCQLGELRNRAAQVAGEGCGREAGGQRDLAVVLGPLRGHHEELGRALRVPHVEESPAARHPEDVVDRRGQVVHAELVEATMEIRR